MQMQTFHLSRFRLRAEDEIWGNILTEFIMKFNGIVLCDESMSQKKTVLRMLNFEKIKKMKKI